MHSPQIEKSSRTRIGSGVLAATLVLASLTSLASAQTPGAYTVTPLVSDTAIAGSNAVVDPGFIDPWGLSAGPTWWISTNGSGLNYVVGLNTVTPPTTPVKISFSVTVPAAGTGTGQPSGSVATKGASPFVLPNGAAASFIFSTTDGTISGWNSKLGTQGAICQIVVNNSAANAVYTGLAILNNTVGTTTTSYLLAPNFGAGAKVEVYNTSFQLTQLAGSFTDPNLPALYAPYSIHVIGSQVFVAYAMRANAQPYSEILGEGNGIVDVYDTNGNFVQRVVTGGNSNAPWGVAFAPANFGIYANDLLIGNFGDGIINVYNPTTFAYLGQLMDGTGKPFVYASLWDLQAGTETINGTAVPAVYFTAGLTNEMHGLFGAFSNNTAATGTPTFGASASSTALSVTNGGSAQAVISVAPTNNFSGMVSLSCTGLPQGASCSFNPTQLSLTGVAPATGSVTIQTTAPYSVASQGKLARGLTYALLLPFASLLLLRRGAGLSKSLRMLCGVLALFASVAWVSGCSYSSPTVKSTPTGAQSFMIVATSGSITQQIAMNLKVQ